MITSSVVLIFIIAVTVYLYNTIVSNHNQAQRAWADVITYEKLKQDVIPQLTEITESFKEFESDFVSKVTAFRESLATLDKDAIDIKALADVETKSHELFSSFQATAEDYPDVASIDAVRQLMQEISDANENVAAAITIFNRAVEKFNNSIQMVPYNVINGLFAKKQKLENFNQSKVMKDYDYRPNF